MNTHEADGSASRQPSDPDALLRRLREEILAEEDAGPLEGDGAEGERWFEAALASIDLEDLQPSRLLQEVAYRFPPDEEDPLPVDVRQRLLDRVSDALLRRAVERGLLPPLLANRREQRRIDIDDLADTLAMPRQQILAIERGVERVREKIEPESLAQWLKAVGIDPDQAREALDRTLDAQSDAPLALAASQSTPPLSGEDRNFRDRVLQALVQPPGGNEGELQ